MHRFWDGVIEPLLDAADASTVVEVGVYRGVTTSLLVERARRTERGVVHAIDPAPKLDVAQWQEEHGPWLQLHQERSHDALGKIGVVDAVLVDGDHNWFTVTGELELLAASAAAHSTPLPLVMAHDVCWPYGRRDMYYDPESLPFEGRHDAARVGVLPDDPELNDDGINPWLWNATHAGGPRNGVLTAIEDFAASQDPPCELLVVDGFHGLGVLASHDRLEASPELGRALAHLRSAEFAQEWVRTIERARLAAEIQAWWTAGRPGPDD